MTHPLLAAYDAITVIEEKQAPQDRAPAGPAASNASAYGQAALVAEAERIRQTGEGSRNDALNQAAFVLGQLVAGGELTEAEVQQELLAAALDAGLGQGEAEQTIESGLAAGEAIPRTAPAPTAYNGFGPAPDGLSNAVDEAYSHDLPMIQVNNRELREVRAEALMALVKANALTPGHPRLYVSSGQLARVVCSTRNEYSVQVLDQSSMIGILADTADWLRVAKKNNVHVLPPIAIARDLLALGEWEGLPALDGIVGCPTFGPDGLLHDTPGHSPDTRLYYAPWVAYPRMALAEAKQLLLEELLIDFPFHDPASLAHAVALALLAFVRPMVKGATPLHLVDAPIAGTGKGLLVDVLTYIGTGRWPGSLTAGRDDDEWRKRLTSSLIRGESHICIDNVDQTLASASLAAALTQATWQDRILGASRVASVPLRQIWAANGNNVRLSDEIARRTAWIRLDANTEKPWLRSQFKHTDLRKWVVQQRPALIGACVAIVQAWLAAGQPAGTVPKGSYSDWAAVMGGILQVAGIDGFLANDQELFSTKAAEQDSLADFVDAWAARYGASRVSSDDLFKLASTPDHPDAISGAEWLGLLDDVLASSNERGRRRSLGRLLGNQQDKVVAGHKIINHGRSNGATWWRLQPMDGTAEDVVADLGL